MEKNMKWFVLATAVVMYVLVIVFPKKKAFFSIGAALLLLITGMMLPGGVTPVQAVTGLINWNVLMIYLGSMIIAALFIYSRVPTRIADIVVDAAPNTGVAIVAILAMTGIISIFVENVATVLVMAPIALALCKKLKMNPTYFMTGLAVMSNLEGTATLVGDPPSMIFASFAGYTFNDFFFFNGRMSIFFIVQAGMLAGCIYFYLYFARHSRGKIEVKREAVVSVFPAVLLAVMIASLASVSFVHVTFPFMSGSIVMFLALIGLQWFHQSQKKSRDEILSLLRDLDWETILFLIGVFVVVGAVAEAGLLIDLAEFLSEITGGSVAAGFLLILSVSILISGFVDNVPYIIVMLPVAQMLAEHLRLNPELYMFALLVGSCLGGNLTPFGASANIVAMGILKKERYPMSFTGWLKIGFPFTLITTGAAAVALWALWS
jgi:Na+/H+ antiporter NhaD/arsenite permease-like protein